jgi:hypothetical protein
MNIGEIKTVSQVLTRYVADRMHGVTVNTLSWLAAIILHCSTIPSLLALLQGLTDKPMPTDIALFVYIALALLFIKSILNRNTATTVTIALGFMIQTVLMSLILFK